MNDNTEFPMNKTTCDSTPPLDSLMAPVGACSPQTCAPPADLNSDAPC